MDYNTAMDVMNQYEYFISREIHVPTFYEKQVDQALTVLSGGNPVHPNDHEPLPNMMDLANMLQNKLKMN